MALTAPRSLRNPGFLRLPQTPQSCNARNGTFNLCQTWPSKPQPHEDAEVVDAHVEGGREQRFTFVGHDLVRNPRPFWRPGIHTAALPE